MCVRAGSRPGGDTISPDCAHARSSTPILIVFDRILAMDEANLFALQRQSSEENRSKLGFFLDYAPGLGINEVPDPYYGADSGFERVLDLCELAASGLLADFVRRRGLR
jgi:protein-tyrosine-phosphatase